MATSITNPASFSSVRTAFNAEGYGISTSLYAYRQGGGIVPATSTFNVIGAGTAGDPLSLSQFNGFSVPSLFVPGSVTYTANGTFVVPSGYTTLTIEAWGGGGQGSGAAQPAGGYTGTPGQDTTVSGTGLTTMVAGGGQGGGPSSSGLLGVGGTGGVAYNGTTTNASGGNGTDATTGTGGKTGTGGTAPSGSISGGAGGAGINSDVPYLTTTAGNPGSGPGGGGGGGVNFVGAMGMCGGQFYSVGGGGGAGSYSKTITSSITPGTVLTVTVGAGGVFIAGASATYGGSGADGRVIITYA